VGVVCDRLSVSVTVGDLTSVMQCSDAHCNMHAYKCDHETVHDKPGTVAVPSTDQ
jgi:hypothetical protein